MAVLSSIIYLNDVSFLTFQTKKIHNGVVKFRWLRDIAISKGNSQRFVIVVRCYTYSIIWTPVINSKCHRR